MTPTAYTPKDVRDNYRYLTDYDKDRKETTSKFPWLKGHKVYSYAEAVGKQVLARTYQNSKALKVYCGYPLTIQTLARSSAICTE